jgi:hypothetical protein
MAAVLVSFSVLIIAAALAYFLWWIPSHTTTGQFVKLYIPPDAKMSPDCFNIGEMEVYSAGVNVAKGKTVTLSSPYGDPKYVASNLVDGDHSTFAHTSCADNGWMMVDLGSEVKIDSIKIWNRPDCCTGRVIGAKVDIMDASKAVKYTSDAFKGKAGETKIQMDNGYMVYTLTPPSTAVVGSDS